VENESLTIKYERLQDILKTMESILIAFSGGVDSALLLRVASEVLKKDCVLAVTARSDTTPSQELCEAMQFAAHLKVPHLIFCSREMDSLDFTKNASDRCYVCKSIRFSDMCKLAKDRGITHVVDGTNLDDHSDYRPGLRANQELGVRSPLSEAMLTKNDIRVLSRKLGLPTWNRPSSACLASRIPYGAEITARKLIQIDGCEDFIRNQSLAMQVRVRHHGDTARIEVEADCMPLLTEPQIRGKLLSYFKQSGFKYVTLDLEGYQMGSMNRVLHGERTKSG